MARARKPRFAFECPRSWESIDPTADATVRHCGTCDRPVHLSRDAREAEANARVGRCVALAVPDEPPSLLRRIWNALAAGLRVLIHGRSPLPLHAIPDPPPPPPPGPSLKMGMFFIPPDPEPPLMGWLVRVDGPERGHTIQCGAPTTRIGSSYQIVTSPSGFVLRAERPDDVVVNGSRGEVFELVDGDRIELGPVRYVFKSLF